MPSWGYDREHFPLFAHAPQPMLTERAEPRTQGRGGADEGIGDQEIAAELLAERFDAGGLVDGGTNSMVARS